MAYKKITRANKAKATLDNFSKDVKKLYEEWQLLKLEVLGYTWGPYDNHQTGVQLCGHFVFEYGSWDQNFLYVNWSRGGSCKLPTTWLDDKNWKKKATKLFLEFEQREMIRQLER